MEDYVIVKWPDTQKLMELEGFDESATLINPNDAMGIDDCTYLVDKIWFNAIMSKL